MRRVIPCFIMAILIFFSNTSMISASDRERGNPTGIYASDKIILSNGNEVKLNSNATLLFVNGALISEYEVIMRNGKAMVPMKLVAQKLGASVAWDGTKGTVTMTKLEKKIKLTINSKVATVNGVQKDLGDPALLYKGITYVPLRFVAENLEATVHYASSLSSKYTYYYDTQMPVSPADTIVRDFASIIIDEQYDLSQSITSAEAMKKTQEICLKGLDNFSKSIREQLISANESPDRLNNELEGIKKEINRMMYIGEVSRFYKFTIGCYDILYDRLNGSVFFVIYSSSTIVKEVDVNDKGLYIPIFIVG